MGDRGMAMQVDPMTPKSKPPGSKRLKLKCDEVLSSFSNNFNLRRYTAAPQDGTFVCNIGDMLQVWTNGVYRSTTHRVLHLVGPATHCSPRHQAHVRSEQVPVK